ncbi:hypothetical protein R3P38DRAFT_3174233 [Favolaschia claudopus]|uniref:Uncharacterized protein n=1 Tax=Favolaschia claudopus TaxID=2862362 RepID=A0AAW0DI24_9AGAR
MTERYHSSLDDNLSILDLALERDRHLEPPSLTYARQHVSHSSHPRHPVYIIKSCGHTGAVSAATANSRQRERRVPSSSPPSRLPTAAHPPVPRRYRSPSLVSTPTTDGSGFGSRSGTRDYHRLHPPPPPRPNRRHKDILPSISPSIQSDRPPRSTAPPASPDPSVPTTTTPPAPSLGARVSKDARPAEAQSLGGMKGRGGAVDWGGMEVRANGGEPSGAMHIPTPTTPTPAPPAHSPSSFSQRRSTTSHAETAASSPSPHAPRLDYQRTRKIFAGEWGGDGRGQYRKMRRGLQRRGGVRARVRDPPRPSFPPIYSAHTPPRSLPHRPHPGPYPHPPPLPIPTNLIHHLDRLIPHPHPRPYPPLLILPTTPIRRRTPAVRPANAILPPRSTHHGRDNVDAPFEVRRTNKWKRSGNDDSNDRHQSHPLPSPSSPASDAYLSPRSCYARPITAPSSAPSTNDTDDNDL